jgi:hypothetical protein
MKTTNAKTANEEILLTALSRFVTRWKALDLKSAWEAEAYMIFEEVGKQAEAAIAQVGQPVSQS